MAEYFSSRRRELLSAKALRTIKLDTFEEQKESKRE